jgi:hypothetical protein
MIRNLKIAIAAAMALAALGAIGASGAQAAEGHCSVESCTITIRPDGIPGPDGTTAHHVLSVRQDSLGASVTCRQVSGDATVAKTFKTLQLGQIVYSTCDVSGTSATVKMNGCEYHFEAPGVVPHDAKVKVVCPVGKEIEIEVPSTGCLMKIGSSKVLSGGLKFHDAETGGIKKDLITAETTLTGIVVTIANEFCSPYQLSKGSASGLYTTGNVELEGETKAGVHAGLWWE